MYGFVGALQQKEDRPAGRACEEAEAYGDG
jgi:hypothetical protein